MTVSSPVVSVEASESHTASGYRRHLLFYGAIGLLLVLDQLTKAWVTANLMLFDPTDTFPWLAPILSFTYVRNTGVAFGLMQGLGRAYALLPLAVVVAVFFFRRSLPAGDLWVHLSLGLVVGGAVGNVVDRLVRGFVVDFLDVNFWPFRNWPVFNLADSAVVVGVAILMLDTFLTDFEESPNND